MMDYFDIDFCGDIFYETKELLSKNMPRGCIVKKIYNEYMSDEYDIVDEISIFGALYYVDKFLNANNKDIEAKMKSIEEKLRLFDDEYDTKVGNLKTFYDSFYIQNSIINSILEESIIDTEDATYKEYDTFLINNTMIHLDITGSMYYTHLKYSMIQNKNYSIGYFWKTNTKEKESNTMYLKHGVFKLEYLKRIYGSYNLESKFVDNKVIVGNDDGIDRYQVAIELSSLILDNLLMYYDNIKIVEPKSSKLKTGEHIFIYSTKYFAKALKRFVSKHF